MRHNVKLDRDQLEAIKLAIESDIEASECYEPEYKNVWQMTYYKHRASALEAINTTLKGLNQ